MTFGKSVDQKNDHQNKKGYNKSNRKPLWRLPVNMHYQQYHGLSFGISKDNASGLRCQIIVSAVLIVMYL